ncbi:MAG: alpha/beta family hydrolase [Steroidobacteraceae bacterium]
MSETTAQPVTIDVDASQHVSGAWLVPNNANACYVFAHGAGAGMHHASMVTMADELALAGIATLRYHFPYIERGSKRTDPPALCHATVRAAVTKARELAPTLPLFAGGRSFGGRMTSQAQALSALPAVRGLAFFGFPLHPAKRPSIERAQHLSNVHVPMLFVQGTRDELAELPLLQPLVERLSAQASLYLVADADHSFHVPARSGRKDADVRREAVAAMATWIERVVRSP